jgi:hypothetical protein
VHIRVLLHTTLSINRYPIEEDYIQPLRIPASKEQFLGLTPRCNDKILVKFMAKDKAVFALSQIYTHSLRVVLLYRVACFVLITVQEAAAIDTDALSSCTEQLEARSRIQSRKQSHIRRQHDGRFTRKRHSQKTAATSTEHSIEDKRVCTLQQLPQDSKKDTLAFL